MSLTAESAIAQRDVLSRLTLTYVDKLQRANADDLAFYPLTTLAKAIEDGHVLTCEDNGEPAGYLWFGALRGGKDTIIYQGGDRCLISAPCLRRQRRGRGGKAREQSSGHSGRTTLLIGVA